VPLASRSDWGAEHRVSVRNQGNTSVTLSVTAGDVARGLALDGLPASLSVPAGQVGEVRVWVRSLESMRPGTERVRPFELQVAGEGSAPVRLRGSLLQVGGPAPAPGAQGQSCLGRLALLATVLVVLAALAAVATSTVTGSLEGLPFAIALVSLAVVLAVVLGALALITGSVALRRLAVAAASVVALAVLAAVGVGAALLGSGTITLGT